MSKIKLGECPYCQSINYSRQETEFTDDWIKVPCECHDCNKEFVEYFGLDEVYSYGGDEEI